MHCEVELRAGIVVILTGICRIVLYQTGKSLFFKENRKPPTLFTVYFHAGKIDFESFQRNCTNIKVN